MFYCIIILYHFLFVLFFRVTDVGFLITCPLCLSPVPLPLKLPLVTPL